MVKQKYVQYIDSILYHLKGTNEKLTRVEYCIETNSVFQDCCPWYRYWYCCCRIVRTHARRIAWTTLQKPGLHRIHSILGTLWLASKMRCVHMMTNSEQPLIISSSSHRS